MFFSRKSTPVDLVTDSEEYTVGPLSPVPSIAPARTPTVLKRKSSQTSIMSRFSRQSLATSMTSTASIVANIKELTQDNALLRDELEQAQEQSKVNQHMLNACVDKLQDKEQENAELRAMIQNLQGELAASIFTDQARDLKTEQRSDGKAVEHKAQVFVLQSRVGELELQVCNYQKQVSVHDECTDKFQAEKESLIRRVTVFQNIDARRKGLINKAQQQIVALTQAYTTEQQQHRCAVENLHTTLQHHLKMHEDRLAVCKNDTEQLQAQLNEARQANINTELANVDKLVELQDQLRRSQVDLDGMAAEKVSWQEWANKQTAALEQAIACHQE